jgi:shikimate dehydrogenase
MKFGLIGYPLGHSFSKAYFRRKFEECGLWDFEYDNFPIADIEEVHMLLHTDVFGLNVTRPHKGAIIAFLNEIDREALEIGAVNTMVRTGTNSWKGFNTDASAFRETLVEWIGNHSLPSKALILGSGGAARAVLFSLMGLGIQPSIVSSSGNGDYSYSQLTSEIVDVHRLIINTTPLGMEPDTMTCPSIPFDQITSQHWLYDLVYNPGNTLFLTHGEQSGARTKNGLDMLHLQAEHAWSIWKMYGKF